MSRPAEVRQRARDTAVRTNQAPRQQPVSGREEVISKDGGCRITVKGCRVAGHDQDRLVLVAPFVRLEYAPARRVRLDSHPRRAVFPNHWQAIEEVAMLPVDTLGEGGVAW